MRLARDGVNVKRRFSSCLVAERSGTVRPTPAGKEQRRQDCLPAPVWCPEGGGAPARSQEEYRRHDRPPGSPGCEWRVTFPTGAAWFRLVIDMESQGRG